MKSSFAQFIIALIVLVLTGGAYGVWYAVVSSQSARAVSLEAEIATKSGTAARISSARAALAEIASSEMVVSSYFISQAGVVDFIDALETQGKALGATVNVLSVSAVGSGNHSSLAISLTATGSFDAVMRTVGQIEFAPYDLVISSVALQKVDKSSWKADINLSLGSTAPVSGTTTDAGVPLPQTQPIKQSTQPTTPSPAGRQPL